MTKRIVAVAAACAVLAALGLTTVNAADRSIGSYSLLTGADTSKAVLDQDNRPVELGMRFQTTRSGQVSAVRFLKASGDVSSRRITIWNDAGTALITKKTAGESAAGWQTVTLNTPLKLSAGSYTVSYGAQRYMATPDFFDNALRRGPLTAPGGRNGVYNYNGGFPTDSYQSSSYWVDVVFNTGVSRATTPISVTSTTAKPVVTTTTVVAPTTTTIASKPATTTTTTAAPVGDQPAPSSGFPDATNTGYKHAPDYPGSLTDCSSTAIASNQTYKFCDFAGGASIGSRDKPVSNVTIYGSRFHAANVGGGLVMVYGDNITFDYDSFEPNVTTTPVPYEQSYQYGITANGSYYTSVQQMTVSHSDFWGFGNAIDTTGSTQAKPQVFRDNYIHDAAQDGGAKYHTDGIGDESGAGKGSYVVIDHNTIMSDGNTNGIAFQAGKYDHFTVTRNLLGGFGYTVAILGSASNTTFTDNTFSTKVKPTFGPLYPDDFWTTSGSVWKNNRWSVPTGAAWGDRAHDGWYWLPGTSSSTASDSIYASQTDYKS